MRAFGRLGVFLIGLVIIDSLSSAQMTFTDNWQKRALTSLQAAQPQGSTSQQKWSALDDPCEPVMQLDRLREIQRLQRKITLLTDETTVCVSRMVNSPPLYPKNAKYSFPTYLKSSNKD